MPEFRRNRTVKIRFPQRSPEKKQPPGVFAKRVVEAIAKANPGMKAAQNAYHSLELLLPSGKKARVKIIAPKRQKREGRGGSPKVKFEIRQGKWVNADKADYLVIADNNLLYVGQCKMIAAFIERKLAELKGAQFVSESYKQTLEAKLTARQLAQNKLLRTIPAGQALRVSRNILRIEQEGWKP